MTKFNLSLLFAGLLAVGVSVSPAHAQLSRTFVSSFGNDANDCNRATPCRTFARAYLNTLPNGEITVLDPGGYGSVSIFSSVSIINDGVGEAGVLVSGGGIGITVNAAVNDHVNLRGLTVKGIGFGGGNGIRHVSGFLTIENCAVRNHTGDGIQMNGFLGANDQSTLVLSNTIVTDNGGNGIFLQPDGAGLLNVVVNRTEIYNNKAHGLGINSNGTALIRGAVIDSVSASNLLDGFVAGAVALTAFARLDIIRSVAYANGGRGAHADGPGASVVLSQNMMVANSVGGSNNSWGFTNGGQAISYGDNVGGGNASGMFQKQ